MMIFQNAMLNTTMAVSRFALLMPTKNVLVISTVRDSFEGLSIADEMLNQCTAKNSPNILNKLRYSGYSSVHLKVNQVN